MKVVVAYNDSEDARAAIRCAADLARETRAELHLAYAVPAPNIPSLASPKLVEDLMASADAAAKQELATVTADLVKQGIRASDHTRRWFPVETLIDRAREVGAELIVIGRRGSSRATQLLIGTISSELVRLAPVSVLVVPKGAAAHGPVLVGVDGSKPSLEALKIARKVWPDAPIVACHVVSRPQGAIPGIDPSIKLIERQGDPAGELLAELESGGYRAIVIGPRGLGQLKGLLLGSVSEKILQLAKHPVLVAR
jgi:nucleotide-binding universal stress UspA family protein